MENGKEKINPYSHSSGGPYGLGDPDDISLRIVERNVVVPKKMKTIAKQEHCSQEIKNFQSCYKEKNYSFFLTCRDENQAVLDCVETWLNNDEFKERCTREYLNERAEYRRTGIPVHKKQPGTKSSR